ncbi:MAG: glycosyltransferase family 39 protein [Anaerolineales bacterium]|nr:glycosyltransferase family 39 protein [Anaerolineales bacterium]
MRKRQDIWGKVFGLLAFFWFVAIVTSYYVLHKPLSPELLLVLAQLSLRVAVAFGILSLAGGLGNRILPRMNLQPLALLSIQAALGTGVFGLLFLVIGSLGGLRPLVGWIVLVACSVVLRRDVWNWWGKWGAFSSVWRKAGKLDFAIAACVALILLFTLIQSLAPPLKFDALVYHLALPRLYVAAGRVAYVPQIMYWGMPQTGEMLYSWAMMLAGDSAAALLGWGFGLLALTGLMGYLIERIGPRSAWVGAASMVSGFTLASALSWAYVDWLAILFGLSFLIVLDIGSQSRRPVDLFLSGVFAGMALATKYTAGVLLVSGLAVILWNWRARLAQINLLSSISVFSLAIVAVVSPWLVKNYLATGNPAYPFLFPSGEMSELRLSLYQEGEPWGGWQDIFLLPLRATFWGLEGSPGYSASIGPLFLGLGLAAWLGWPSFSQTYRKTVAHAAAIALPVILIWMVLGRFSSYLLQSRLYFAVFPALAVLAGAGYYSLCQIKLPGVRLGRVIGVMALLVLALNTYNLGIQAIEQRAMQAALGLSEPEEYLDRNLGWYAPAMRTLRELPEPSKVLMLWETRSLYCIPKCEPDEIIDRWLRERYSDGATTAPRTTQEILNSWEQAGYTHLLFYNAGAEHIQAESISYRDADWLALYELLEQLEVAQNFGETYTLYRLDR